LSPVLVTLARLWHAEVRTVSGSGRPGEMIGIDVKTNGLGGLGHVSNRSKIFEKSVDTPHAF